MRGGKTGKWLASRRDEIRNIYRDNSDSSDDRRADVMRCKNEIITEMMVDVEDEMSDGLWIE